MEKTPSLTHELFISKGERGGGGPNLNKAISPSPIVDASPSYIFHPVAARQLRCSCEKSAEILYHSMIREVC